MNIVIVLPTYNERENIGLLINELQIVFKSIKHQVNVLVVDDNSPDGTAAIVREAMESHQNVHLISGEKLGLGAAYIRGMTYALRILQADVIMEMDADFSHLPADPPRLIAALEDGADFVIGSRYVGGRLHPQ
jgi:dolichol-phosphate mannosyltransferase